LVEKTWTEDQLAKILLRNSGFQLTPQGITPGMDKLKAVADKQNSQHCAWCEAVSRSLQLLQRTCLELCPGHRSSQRLNPEGLPMEDGADAAEHQLGFPRITTNSDLEAVGPLSSARAALCSHHRHLSRGCQEAQGVWDNPCPGQTRWLISSYQLYQPKIEM